MALETTYEGPPSLKIYQEFVRVSTSAAIEQDVVILAPHYDVYTADNTEAVAHTTGTATTKVWPSGKTVDTSNAKVYAKNAYCTQATCSNDESDSSNEISLKTGVKNGIVFNKSVVTGFEEPVEVGDVIQFTGGSSSVLCNVIDIDDSVVEQTLAASDIKKQSSGSWTTSNDFTVDSTYNKYLGGSTCVYYLKVKSTAASAVTFTYSTSDGRETPADVTLTSTAAFIGSSGIKLAIAKTASNYTVGDVYKFEVEAKGIRENRVVYVDKDLYDSTAPQTFSARLGKAKEFYLNPSQYHVTSSGVTTEASIQQTVWTGIPNSLVLKADLYFEYRANNDTYTKKLTSIGANDTVSSYLGNVSVDNPIGCMVQAARKGGQTVYFVAVNSDTVAAYERAFSLISKSTNAYALVLHSVRQDVVAAATTFIEQQSAPEVANYKILYYGLNGIDEKAIMEKNASGLAFRMTITSGACVLETASAGAITFLTAGVREGDIVRTNYARREDGTMTYNEYTVADITDGTHLTLKETEATSAGLPINFEIWRNLEGSELIDELKTRVYTSNRRCYCVFGDGINVDGIEDAPAWLLAALPAGMRSGEYCQRPISNIAYDGVTAEPKMVFSASERMSLASRGVWILASNDDGSQVYNYHQLSTDMTDKKTQEQSYTTNFDSISFGARALLAPYYGNSNISAAFLQQVLANVDAFLVSKTKNAPSTTVGPQLISYTNLTIEQDSVNKDHVYMYVDYDMPAPFNHIEFHQRLL